MRVLILLFITLCAETAAAQVFTPTRVPISETAESERMRDELAQARQELRVEREQEAIAQSQAVRGMESRTEAAATAAAARIRTLEANVARLENLANTPDRARFLTQGALEGLVREDAPTVSIQAADLFLDRSGVFRVYLRSTLSTEAEDEEEEGEDEDSDQTEAAAALEERIKSALLDPYGGLLYFTTGALRQVAGPVATPEQTPRGLFLDIRGGVKAVELSEGTAEERNPVVPFATFSAGLTFQWPVWNSISDASDDNNSVGDVVFGLTWVGNGVLDKDASDLFTGDEPKLDEWTNTLALSAGISLKGIAKLTFTGNPWSSNSSLGKRFTVGLTLVRED